MAKRIVWDIFKKYASHLPGVTFNENDLRIDIAHNNAKIQLLSAENPRANVGVYSDIVALDEFGDQPPSVWTEVFRPTLSDRKGRAIFAGTLRGTNHFYELFQGAKSGRLGEEWTAFDFKATETGIIPEEELESLRKTMPEEEFAQEYLNDAMAAGAIGAYFAKLIARAHIEKRIEKIPHDPELLVDTYWDLGISDATAIWFVQTCRGKHHIIDYLEVVDGAEGIGTVVGALQDKARQLKYNYGRTCLPHDAKARDLGTGKTILQELDRLGVRKMEVVPRISKKMDSINAARMALPKCFFDAEKCVKGITALQHYKKKWNEQMQCFGDSPMHDWSSHGADAFQCFAMAVQGNSKHDYSAPGSGSSEEEAPHIEVELSGNPYSWRDAG
jgi:hypothetical protein